MDKNSTAQPRWRQFDIRTGRVYPLTRNATMADLPLTTRLRGLVVAGHNPDGSPGHYRSPIGEEAAAALEAKDAEIKALESANDGLICTRDRMEAEIANLRATLGEIAALRGEDLYYGGDPDGTDNTAAALARDTLAREQRVAGWNK